jgi:hypothetical protein
MDTLNYIYESQSMTFKMVIKREKGRVKFIKI